MEKIDKALKWSYGLLFLITPLIVLPITSELFEFNKMIVIYLLSITILSLWILKSIFLKKIVIRKSFLDIPILIFFISQLLSTIFSIDRQTSLFGYYGRFNGGLVSITAYILLYYCFISNFNVSFIKDLLKLSLITSVLVIIWGIPGKLNHDLSCLIFTNQLNNSCWTDQFHPELRMFSTLGQPNWLGAYLVIHFFIGLFFFAIEIFKQDKKNKNLLLYCGYLILNFSGILFTRSRSAYLALGIGVFIFIVFYIKYLIKLCKGKEKKTIGIIGLLFLLAIIFFKTGIPKIDNLLQFKLFKKQTTKQIQPQKNLNLDITESFDIRKIVWKGAVDLGFKYPLFGTGVETFAYSYYFTRPKAHNLTSEWDFLYNKAHNEYLNYFATTGFLGIGSYLLLIFIFILLTLKELKTQNSKLKTATQNSKVKYNNSTEQWNGQQLLVICLLLAYVSILITNFFGFSITTINLCFYLIPAFIFVLVNKENKSYEIQLKEKPYVMYVVLLLITFYLLMSTIFYWVADTKYAQGEIYSRANDYQTSASYLLQALSLRKESIYKDRLSFALANLAYVVFYNKENSKAKELIKLSEEYNLRTLKDSPKNVLNWKTKAKDQYLYYQATLKPQYLKNGIDALLTAKKLSLTDPKIDYSLSIYYSLLYDEAIDKNEKNEYQLLSMEAINKSLLLKLDYTDAISVKEQLMKKYKLIKD